MTIRETEHDVGGVGSNTALVTGGTEVEVAGLGAEPGVLAEPEGHECDHASRVRLAAAAAGAHVGGAGSRSRGDGLCREVRDCHSAPSCGAFAGRAPGGRGARLTHP